MTRKPSKRAGRKPQGDYPGVSAVFSTRITPALRKKLERAAKNRGRSLSQEINLRLDKSFKRQEHDPFVSALLYLIEMAALKVTPPGRELRLDAYSFEAFEACVDMLLNCLKPSGMPVAPEVDGSEYFKAVMKHPLLVGQMKAGAILRELSTAPPPDINLSDQRMRRYHDWHYALPRLRRDLGIPFDKDDFALSVRSYEGVRKLADDEGLCRELAQGDEETRLRILERLGIVLTEEVVAKEDVLSEALLSEADKLRGLSKK